MSYIQERCLTQSQKNIFNSNQEIGSIEAAINDIKVIADMKTAKYVKFISKAANKHELIELLKYINESVSKTEPILELDLSQLKQTIDSLKDQIQDFEQK